MKPAVFWDKDGTLLVDVPHNVDGDRIELMPQAAGAARRLHEAGYALVVVTNQSGVARGYFTADDLGLVARRVSETLAAARAPLSGFYYCPHLPEDELPAECPQCTGEMRSRCPACAARVSSAFAVECESCGAALRPAQQFGVPIRRQQRSR